MKNIIDGKLCDTETAEEIFSHEWETISEWGHYRYTDILYKKRVENTSQ